jgi:hypothetical protein
VLLTVGHGCRSVCICSLLFDREVWYGVVKFGVAQRGDVVVWCGVYCVRVCACV